MAETLSRKIQLEKEDAFIGSICALGRVNPDTPGRSAARCEAACNKTGGQDPVSCFHNKFHITECKENFASFLAIPRCEISRFMTKPFRLSKNIK
jgi:hypothetical protein